MKWTYIIKRKMQASGMLLLLCLLVLLSNYIDRNHTDNVKNAISTLYEDRLIAEEYILKMTSGVYQIKEVINSNANDSEKSNNVKNIFSRIIDKNNAYLKTKFTDIEKRKAGELLNTLNEFELIHLSDTQTKLASANKALAILNELSTVQLNESKRIMYQAESLYQSSKISSQFVFAIIIVILIVLQALVFASKTLLPNVKSQSSNLN